jgi:hypothetical protein
VDEPEGTLDHPYLLSYRRLRLGIGIIGFALPFVLVTGVAVASGEAAVEPSISDYYHTPMRDWLVGSLCAVGVFLLFYRFRRVDYLVTNLAGVLAVGVALFPTSAPEEAESVVSWIHYTCAAGLFLALAYVSWFLFPERPPGVRGSHHESSRRNVVYRTCAAVMIGCVVAAALNRLLGLDIAYALFWLETLAVLAFGVSWLVKGRVEGTLAEVGHRLAEVAPFRSAPTAPEPAAP